MRNSSTVRRMPIKMSRKERRTGDEFGFDYEAAGCELLFSTFLLFRGHWLIPATDSLSQEAMGTRLLHKATLQQLRALIIKQQGNILGTYVVILRKFKFRMFLRIGVILNHLCQ